MLPRATVAQPSGGAFLKLIEILRDRGSISSDEYEQLEMTMAGHDAEADAVESVDSLHNGSALAPAGDVPSEAPSKRWYGRFNVRGYTQFRTSEVFGNDGPAALEMPSDRSVLPNETFVLRRGRFILSGDVGEHLSIYAQPDLTAFTGAPDFSLQLRDLYADVTVDKAKTFRFRVGQSKVPFGFVNLQSSQSRGPFERSDALNFAVEGERDLGAYLMWAPAQKRQLFADLVAKGLKGSGDYGVVAIGAYDGQGPNRSDLNGQPHWVARASYPFVLSNGQIFEVGIQGYTGRFVASTQAMNGGGIAVTPTQDAEGTRDQRLAVSAAWYPQPVGFEFEWNWGSGPTLSDDGARIREQRLQGGAVQVHYRRSSGTGWWFPFARWQYYDGGRKFARNAPGTIVNEADLGLEIARWSDLEVTGVLTHTFERTRTSSFPYVPARNTNRLGIQVQWSY